MNDYVYIVSEQYRLLLKASSVLEIISLEEESRETNGHLSWRGLVIPSLSMRTLLGKTSNPKDEKMGVVFQHHEDDDPVHVKIDSVLGLKQVPDQEFLPLPPLPGKTALLFDGAWLDRERADHVYLLRNEVFSR